MSRIIAVGASAGGLEALKAFFSNLNRLQKIEKIFNHQFFLELKQFFTNFNLAFPFSLGFNFFWFDYDLI